MVKITLIGSILTGAFLLYNHFFSFGFAVPGLLVNFIALLFFLCVYLLLLWTKKSD
ncbi:hypothetical protein ACJYYY_07035 [Brochothrix campestris]|uniref:hypothetical protein n=1 Tax=Brochothrix campestris TaxID=2757 RepID=UPI0038D08A14